MNEPQHDDRRNNHWRLTKDVSLPLLLGLIGQTLYLVWSVAGQNAALNTVIKTVAEAQALSYTKTDAYKERELMDQRFLNHSNREDEILRRLTIVEGKGGK